MQTTTKAMHRGNYDDSRLRSDALKICCSRKRRLAQTRDLATSCERPRFHTSPHPCTSDPGPGSARRRNRRVGRTPPVRCSAATRPRPVLVRAFRTPFDTRWSTQCAPPPSRLVGGQAEEHVEHNGCVVQRAGHVLARAFTGDDGCPRPFRKHRRLGYRCPRILASSHTRSPGLAWSLSAPCFLRGPMRMLYPEPFRTSKLECSPRNKINVSDACLISSTQRPK